MPTLPSELITNSGAPSSLVFITKLAAGATLSIPIFHFRVPASLKFKVFSEEAVPSISTLTWSAP